MAGPINKRPGKRSGRHTESKSSECRQTTNRVPPTIVQHSATTQKPSTSTKASSVDTKQNSHTSLNMGNDIQANPPSNETHSVISSIHCERPPVNKTYPCNCPSNPHPVQDGELSYSQTPRESLFDKHTPDSAGSNSLFAQASIDPSSMKQPFYAFGWPAYRTRVHINEVCQLFLRGSCRYGENCHRIHPLGDRPPGTPVIRVKLAKTSQPPAPWTNLGDCDGVDHLPRDAHNGIILVKLPEATLRPTFPLERRIEHTEPYNNPQIKGGRSVVSGVSAPSNRFNESFLLNRSLLSKHTNGQVTSPSVWRHNGQSTSSSTSDSTSSSSRMTSPQSSTTEELEDFRPTSLRKLPPPPPSKQACKKWLLGRCSRGYNCPYVHDDLNYDPPVKGIRPPPRYSTTCLSWLRDQCSRGYFCDYVHGDLEYTTPRLKLPAAQPRTARETFVEKRNQHASSSQVPPVRQLSVAVDNHARVTLGPGFEVREVMTGFETPWISIGNVPIRVTADEICRLLDSFGPILDIRFPGFSNSPFVNVKVRLSTSTLATQASTSLNNTLAFGGTITACLPISNAPNTRVAFRDTTVRIQWEAPGKVGYCGYSSSERAHRAIAAARIPFRDNYVKASIHSGLPVVGVVTVKFDGVPIDANEGDMERFAHPDEVVWERPNYNSLPRAIDGIRKILEDQRDLVSLDILPPPYKAAKVSAWAHFSTIADAQGACSRLHGRRLWCTGNTLVFARHMRSLGFSITPGVYEKVGPDIDLFQKSVWRQSKTTSISIVHRPAPQTVLVKLSSEDLKELGRLKSEFEKILNGEVLQEAKKAGWDDFFVHPEGRAFLEAVERENPGVTIRLDVARRNIKLLGSFKNREIVRHALLSKIALLRSQRVRTIPLDGSLIGVFVLGALDTLRHKVGRDNVVLAPLEKCLRIRGDDSIFEVAEEFVRTIHKQYAKTRRISFDMCPVCLDQVTSPVNLRCGHTWCRSCLSSYLMSSIHNKYFPLACLGDDAKCTERIPLDIAQQILPNHDLDAIAHAAFSSYVQSRPEEFHYCPSPDCPQVYRATAGGAILQCPSCLLRICPRCHVEAHDGFGCPDPDDDDDHFREWVREHDVKNCPGCKIPIERIEGCNHMTCTRCQTHICWECLETFPKGQGIYDHMRSVHGGIGLAPVEV